MIHRQETALFNPNAIKNDMEKSRLLSQLITQSMGLFRTEKVTYNGGVVIFMHDKPKLEDSMTVWKISADGMKVSTDGMLTWNAGIDSEGNATVNLLETVGISFDWAKGGTLTLGGAENGHGKLAILDDKGKEKVIADKDGIQLKNGSKLLGDNGILGTINYTSGMMQKLGGYLVKVVDEPGLPPQPHAEYIYINVSLPSNFTPVKATLVLDTYGIQVGNTQGYSRNIKLLKVNYTHEYNNIEDYNFHNSGVVIGDTGDLDGTMNGSSNSTSKRLVSGDLIPYLDSGLTTFLITSELSPNIAGMGQQEDYSYIGDAFANITVVGYLK